MINSKTLATILQRSTDLSNTALHALAILDSQGDQSLGSLASKLDLTGGGITCLADSLEGRGLATRTRTKTDRRTIYLTLTPLGQKTVQRILQPA